MCVKRRPGANVPTTEMSNPTETTNAEVTKMTDDELYKQNIERLMLTGSTEIISNSLPQHAAALLACFFRNARSEIKIFCNTLRCQVYDTPEVLSSMFAAARKDITIQILVRDIPESDSKFLKRFQEEAKLRPTKLVLETDAGSRSNLMKHIPSNFAVMDQKAFRWETDCKNIKAVACMNGPTLSMVLGGVFDRLYESIRQTGAQHSAA